MAKGKKSKKQKKKKKQKKSKLSSPLPTSVPSQETVESKKDAKNDDQTTYYSPPLELDQTEEHHFSPPKEVLNETPSLWIRWVRLIILPLIIFFIVLAHYAKKEIEHSEIQAEYFHTISKDLTMEVLSGDSELFLSPNGPFDLRLGYSRANQFRDALKSNGFIQTSHTSLSSKAIELSHYGINFPYKEKFKAGIDITSEDGEKLYRFTEPAWVFEDFESVNKLIVDTLLFIEDRSILDKNNPLKNPAVEWDRFFKAIIDLIASKFTGADDVPGGSTLATQIEKFKHSEGGRTAGPLDKLRQMYSASLRAYHESKETLKARKEIVLDYINSVPLAAVKGYGEIHGLGDGLWAYFGEDPKKLNEKLAESESELDEEKLKEKAIAYRKVLSLFLAHRRPSDYLDDNPQDLQLQVDTYLPLLFKEGIVSYDLFKSALATKVKHRRVLPAVEDINFSKRKGPNVVRNHLLNYLKLNSLYELDRLDLEVVTTLNVGVQEEISRQLLKLHSPTEVKKLGLDGFRLLSTNADPRKVIYSFTLYEHKDGVNRLRVQTDTYDQPFNINEGVKLDLGSTSKYRTIVTYLEVIEEIFKRYEKSPPQDLKKALNDERDPLSKWGITWLMNQDNLSLPNMLEAALDRQYSANPGERFFTGGGLHHFSNFNSSDNGKVLPIRLALRNSVNLPFIRLMRDLVKYYSYHTEGSTALTLANMDENIRTDYLRKFADQEGKVFLRRFYDKYKNKTADQIFSILLDSTKHLPKRFAAVYWFINPEANLDDFIAFMKKHIDHEALNKNNLAKYYDWYTKRALTLGDKGYLARLHPLELWVAAYLIKNPDATLQTIFENSYSERIEVYDWLMKTSRKHAQDKRIQILLEAEAFQEIYQKWKNVGYPLSSLVPSYATALGTSADRPDALAELMGIIMNDGKRYKKAAIESLQFGRETPYEASYKVNKMIPQQVISEEVARAAKPLLFDIVQQGTAIRLKDGLKIGDKIYPVGGKTGTGDHRYQVYGKGGGVVEKRVVNRTATFMFIIGDKYYGVVSAFVPGREAANYKFTSALPVQILKIISPALEGLEKGE